MKGKKKGKERRIRVEDFSTRFRDLVAQMKAFGKSCGEKY